MKFRSLISLLVLSSLGALVVAGCGGGGSSSSDGGASSSSGSSSSFVSGAEAACTNANKQIAALGTPQQDEVLQYLEKTELVIEKLAKEVAAMGGSGSAEAAYTEALAESVPILNRMSNAARNENFDAVRELSDELVELELGESAKAAGLTACAEVSTS
jgi:hypothetical protein